MYFSSLHISTKNTTSNDNSKSSLWLRFRRCEGKKLKSPGTSEVTSTFSCRAVLAINDFQTYGETQKDTVKITS